MTTRRSLRTLPMAVLAASSLLALIAAPAMAHTGTPSDPAAFRLSLLQANQVDADATEEAALEALIDSLGEQIDALEVLDDVDEAEEADDVDEVETDEAEDSDSDEADDSAEEDSAEEDSAAEDDDSDEADGDGD